MLPLTKGFDFGRIVSVDVLHHHSSVATLFCDEARDEPHRPTPIDLYAGTNALLGQHHVDPDRTSVVKTAQARCPPSPYRLEILQRNVLSQPSELLLFGCHPIPQVRSSLVGVEEGQASILNSALSIEPELKGEVGHFMQELLHNNTSLSLQNAAGPSLQTLSQPLPCRERSSYISSLNVSLAICPSPYKGEAGRGSDWSRDFSNTPSAAAPRRFQQSLAIRVCSFLCLLDAPTKDRIACEVSVERQFASKFLQERYGSLSMGKLSDLLQLLPGR